MGARVGWRGPGANPPELTALFPEATGGSQREYDHETGQQQYSVLDHEAVPLPFLSLLPASHLHIPLFVACCMCAHAFVVGTHAHMRSWLGSTNHHENGGVMIV